MANTNRWNGSRGMSAANRLDSAFAEMYARQNAGVKALYLFYGKDAYELQMSGKLSWKDGLRIVQDGKDRARASEQKEYAPDNDRGPLYSM